MHWFIKSNSLEDFPDILQRIAQGDRQLFKQLYQQQRDLVYNLALNYSQNETDAEEITQEVFIQVFRKAAQFQGKSSVKTWIYRITVNTSLNFLKKKKRRSWLWSEKIEETPKDFAHPGVLLERKEQSIFLFKGIDQLPDQQNTAFLLCFIEELPRQEAAYVMGVSLKALESLLQRAKKNLRKILETLRPNQ